MNRYQIMAVAVAGGVLGCGLLSHSVLSQSGRQKKNANAQPSATPASTRPREAVTKMPPPPVMPSRSPTPAPESTPGQSDDVVRVSSHLVPVPATVLDVHGAAVTNLKIEDFELVVDGDLKPISDIYRAETPVRMAMLFDNSGSLDASREFEKRAAMRFFHSVMRPADQAAIYSVATNIELSQPMTNNVSLLERTIDGFGKPEGATSLYDGIFAAITYLKPYAGRRVIVIVSDGRDTTSREDHDFEATRQRLSSDECQVYVVQTGLYDNANVRDLTAERRMQAFAEETGGESYVPHSVSDLDNTFAQIAADLAQQYILSYYPAADKRDGKYHQIIVRVKTKEATRIRARKGFLVKTRDQG
ncbi:MAG TPA: VWA domain-containing protein [Pyrinomonadaceae bacterium]|nr:VWA domain-containing protein [Pyrinomonadaceae bacterium]